MSCVDSELLEAFVMADLGEHQAGVVALHLDDCPSCSARAACLDPLARAFASVNDPVVPDDLVASILEEAHRPAPAWTLPAEVAVGAVLLLSACCLGWLAAKPVWVSSGAFWYDSGMHAVRGLSMAAPGLVWLVLFSILALAGAQGLRLATSGAAR